MKDEKLKSYLQERLGDYNHPVGDDILPSIIRNAQRAMYRKRLRRRLVFSAIGIGAVVAALVLILAPLRKNDAPIIASIVGEVDTGISDTATFETVESSVAVAAVIKEPEPTRPAAADATTIEPEPAPALAPAGETVIAQDTTKAMVAPEPSPEPEQKPEPSPKPVTATRSAHGNAAKDDRRYVWTDDPASLLPKEKRSKKKRDNVSLRMKMNGLELIGQNNRDDIDSTGDIIADDGTVLDFSDPDYDFPVNIRLTARKRIAGAFSLESGISYTVLGTNGNNAFFQQHYLGIPIKGVYTFNPQSWLRFYVSGGGMGEWQVDAKVFSHKHGNSKLRNRKIQWSVEATAGMEVGLGRRIGLFLEPGISYFFDDRSGIPTIRKEKPLDFSFKIGLSFRID